MGTEVLRPQDFFYDRFRLTPPAFHRRKSYFNGFNNPRPNNSGQKRPISRSERSELKKKPQQPKRSSSADELQSQIGRVTILKRGQSLDTVDAARMKKDSTNGTLIVKKQFMEKDDIYAGSAFFASPSPSSLPLPSFFSTKKEEYEFHDSATRDLRRLLRLE